MTAYPIVTGLVLGFWHLLLGRNSRVLTFSAGFQLGCATIMLCDLVLRRL